MNRSRLAAAIVVLAIGFPAYAVGDTRALLEQAIDAYTLALNTEARDVRLEGFRRAERLFGRVIESGLDSPDLYVNLGNAALQAERLGGAVLAYRRALRLDPDHARALQNLEHARTLLPEWVPRPESGGVLDSFFFWHRTLSWSERSLAAAFCFALAGLLVALSVRLGQATLRNFALLPAAVWVALLASLVLDPTAWRTDQAVVTGEGIVARVADSALAPSPFPEPLPGGVEVRILEERSPWVRVRLANGRDAWVTESGISRIAVGFQREA
jgi:tetratricopeptide (TPR) repeat protein